ncbi:hypothetical protein 1 [Wuhan insect virus 35]|uniref:hypothetical protein 1 n=1 Tax=Wuhan insect virus 35 TaxID=1923738 RepID=UPI00090C48C0|nr:hypothetical protein 1 [Wuhan insect virus 35]APG76548.1 hypothetical protein 1 [Wuhan insect virus 35]
MDYLRQLMQNFIGGEPDELPEEQAVERETQLDQIINTLDRLRRVQQLTHEIDDARTAPIPQGETAEERVLRGVRAQAEVIEHRQVIDDKTTPPSVDDCYAFLKTRCEGKLVDGTYNAYCAALIRQYFATRKPVSNKMEYAIMNSVMNMHLINIRPQYDYDLHDILRYNDCINYVQRKTIRIFNQIIEIPFTRITLEDLNIFRPAATSRPINFLWKLFLALSLIIIAYYAVHFITLPFTLLTTFTTTHNQPQQPSQPIITATDPSYYQTITHLISTWTTSSTSSNDDYSHGPLSSIYHQWIAPASESFTRTLTLVYYKDAKPALESLLSLSWRKCQHLNTKLQDLYKEGTPHLTYAMDAISNHWNAVSKATDTLAKELTTILAAKYTSSLANINTTLRETILPLTLTSLSKCYDYATDFIYDVTNKAPNYLSSVKKQLETELLPAMEKSIQYAAQECPAMWTQALEIASSIITSSGMLLNDFISTVMRLSTETISSYSQTLKSQQQNSQTYYGSTIWKQLLVIVLILYTKLNFAVADWFIIPTAIPQWPLTRID